VERVESVARACRGHPAILAYSIGNEIPASVVRWYGYRRIERHLRRLCDASKQADPDTLVTYVNYPPTEYLDLTFLDMVSFNVFLEDRARLERYRDRARQSPERRSHAGRISVMAGAGGLCRRVRRRVRVFVDR
jgi:hypothetical protein